MGKKSKKKADWCKAYRAAGTREKNKAIKIYKHVARHPEDVQGHKDMEKYSQYLPKALKSSG